jgi:hypothetical protein
MKNVIKICPTTTDRNDGALIEVCTETSEISKALKDLTQVLNVIFDRGHKNCRVVRIKRGAKNGAPTPKLVKQTESGGSVENVSERVNGEHKKKAGREGPLA